MRFRDELLDGHASDHVDLVFSNVGIGGGRSVISDSRQERGRTFAVDWRGLLLRPRVLALRREVPYCPWATLARTRTCGDSVETRLRRKPWS